MKFTPVSAIIITILTFSLTSVQSQESSRMPDHGMSNAEPAHAFFTLGDESRFALQLKPMEMSQVKYQGEFNFQPWWNGKQVFVSIHGIHAPFDLKINGFKYGSGEGKGGLLEFNITPFLTQGANVIELNFNSALDHTAEQVLNACTLLIRASVHVRDLEVTSYFQPDIPQPLVRVHLYIQSYLQQKNRGRSLTMNILDPDGEIIKHREQAIDFPLAFRQEIEFTFDQNIEGPRLWSPSHPDLYKLQLSMAEKGQTEGELISAYFGIRKFSFVDSVLFVNKDTIVPVLANDELLEDIENLSEKELIHLLQERGANGIESNHQLPERLLDLFDRQGIVVLRKLKDRDLTRDRPDVNRPSLIWLE